MAVAAGEEGESDRRHRAHAPALVEARKEVPRLLQRGKYEARQIVAHPVQGRGVQMSISYRSNRDPALKGANAYFVSEANLLH